MFQYKVGTDHSNLTANFDNAFNNTALKVNSGILRSQPLLYLPERVANENDYLRVNADYLIALFASIGEDALVALDAVRMFIAKHVALTCQRLVALPAAEVAAVPVLVHRLGVFAAENQLQTREFTVNEDTDVLMPAVYRFSMKSPSFSKCFKFVKLVTNDSLCEFKHMNV